MQENLKKRGIDFWDPGTRNVGFDREGQLRIIDAGSLEPVHGNILPRAADQTGQQPGFFKNALLNILGADKSVQAELAAKVGGPKPGIPERYYRPNKGAVESFNSTTPIVGQSSGANELMAALRGRR